MTTHYLLDHKYWVDKKHCWGRGGHLLAFNPGPHDAKLNITLYFTDRDPITFSRMAPAGRSSESNQSNWPIQPDVTIALVVECSEPIICQTTTGWNNTMGEYDPPKSHTKDPHGVLRESARSYMALTRLSQDWYYADGIVIDNPKGIWVRESEYALLLNPNDQPANVVLALHYDEVVEHKIVVPPQRLKEIYMDDIAIRNKHYGVRFISDQPIATQWIRVVQWYDRPDPMTFWSVPCVPGPLV